MSKRSGFTKDQKEELAEFFASSFRDVLLPALDDLSLEFKSLKEDFDEIREELGTRIEKYHNHMVQITDIHGDKLDDHEKRIKKLEAN